MWSGGRVQPTNVGYGNYGYGYAGYGYNRRVNVITTNESLQPERAACLSCWSYVLILNGITFLFCGIPLLGIGYGACGGEYDGNCDFSGLRAAGIILAAIGAVSTIIPLLICCCVIKPTCCGYTMSEGMQRRYNQQNNMFVTTVGGPGVLQVRYAGQVTASLQPGYSAGPYGGIQQGLFPPGYTPNQGGLQYGAYGFNGQQIYTTPIGNMDYPTAPPPAYPGQPTKLN